MTSDVKRHRILAVDDEQIVLSLVNDALEDMDIDIRTSNKSVDAVALIMSEHFDLLLTDIRMPGMDGIELAMKARDIHPGIGVIFMTGYANLDSAKGAIKQGAFDYIMKPFELTEIRESVSDALERVARDAAGKDSGQQLESLTDFSHKLHTVSDPTSLVTVSLNFAILQSKALAGVVVFGTHPESPTQLVIMSGTSTQTLTCGTKTSAQFVETLDQIQLPELHTCTSFQSHPLMCRCDDSRVYEAMKEAFADVNGQIVSVPMSRGSQSFGVMMIGLPAHDDTSSTAHKRFLQIAAGQLALSLENIILLEQARAAYTQLKELQDQTIDLERMAARGEMSAEIGHELNNFIGVISGNLSLAEYHMSKGHVADTMKYIAPINDTIEKIKRFTSGLMDMKSISSRRETLSLDKLLIEVIEYLRPQKRFRDVSIFHEIGSGLYTIDADPIHLQQLLHNLFNNAADAMIDSSRKEIAVRLTSNPGSGISLTIVDTGCGIDPELLKKAFRERFTTKKTGHGYGLIVCTRIIETYGGTLQVQSTVGHGTSISIAFPIHCDQNATSTIRVPIAH